MTPAAARADRERHHASDPHAFVVSHETMRSLERHGWTTMPEAVMIDGRWVQPRTLTEAGRALIGG